MDPESDPLHDYQLRTAMPDRSKLPSITVIAESHSVAQRWIHEVGLGRFFNPRVVRDGNGMRGVTLYVEHETFEDWYRRQPLSVRLRWDDTFRRMEAQGVQRFTQVQMEAQLSVNTPG